jgi:lambda repressor-like predicted transcriptional regulator
MNLASEELLKRSTLESVLNKDFNKFKQIAKELETLTYQEMIAESAEKIKRAYR